MTDETKVSTTEPKASEDATPVKSTNTAVSDMLKSYGASDEVVHNVIVDLGVESTEDLSFLEVNDLISAGMPLAKARKMIAEMQKSNKATAVSSVPTPVETRVIPNSYEALLPNIPNDDSWLNALKTGGILKVDESSYIAAIRAALADRAGLYGVPEALVKAMEKFADETEEQVDPIFYSLRKSLTRKAYGDIFAAIDGLDGTFITESRRKDFLSYIRKNLWPAIAESYHTLDAWYQTYKASFADPSMIFSVFSGANPAGLNIAPDTSAIHDAGDSLVNAINHVFRGTGVQVVAALAYDANTIRKTMEDPRLPAMIGAKNREMMLKKIGANVSSNYIRMEQNIVKYVLAFVKHDTITSDVEVNYFIEMWKLGAQINWADLDNSQTSITSITGRQIF